MENNFLGNNPLLQGMSPEKLQFLANFANSSKPTDIKDMMPFLMASANTAKQNNIQFNDAETDLLVSILKQNMSPEEAAKADQLRALMRGRRTPSR